MEVFDQNDDVIRVEHQDRDGVLHLIAQRSRDVRLRAGADPHDLLMEIMRDLYRTIDRRFRLWLILIAVWRSTPERSLATDGADVIPLVDQLVDDLIDAPAAPPRPPVASVAA